jgi:hypothetical protein
LIIVALTSEQFLADFGCSQAELVLGQDPSFRLWELAHPSMFLAKEPAGAVISLRLWSSNSLPHARVFLRCNHSAGSKAFIK